MSRRRSATSRRCPSTGRSGRLGEANAIRSLGDVALSQDRYEQAGERYEQALPIYRQIGARLGEANTLLSMGRLARQTGDEAQMKASLRQAESIYESIGLKDWARRAREVGRRSR